MLLCCFQLSFKNVDQKSFSFLAECLILFPICSYFQLLVHGLFPFVCYAVSKLCGCYKSPGWVSGCTHEMNSSKGKFICLGFFHFSHPSENSNISLKMLSKKIETDHTEGEDLVQLRRPFEGEPILSAMLSKKNCS